MQKIGGIAALGHTAVPGVDMVLSFTVMIPLLNAPPERGLNFLTDSKTIIFRYGLYYVFFATVEVACMLLIIWFAWKWKSVVEPI